MIDRRRMRLRSTALAGGRVIPRVALVGFWKTYDSVSGTFPDKYGQYPITATGQTGPYFEAGATYTMANNATLRGLLGHTDGAASTFYGADNLPVAVSYYTLVEFAVGPRLFYNPSRANKGMALYSTDKTVSEELNIWQAMGSQYALPTPTAFFNGIDTTGMTSFTGGSTTFVDVDGKLRIAPTNSLAKTGMRVATTVAEGATLGSELLNIASAPSILDSSGCVGTYSTSSKVLSNTAIGTNSDYPRFSFTVAAKIIGKRYYARIEFSDASMINGVRLATSGTSQDLAKDGNVFSGDIVGDNTGTVFQIRANGTSLWSSTIISATLTEVTPTYYDTTSTGTPIVSSTDQVTRTSATTLDGSELGPELLPNPSFDSNTTGWDATRCTIASVAGGQSGNCLELTYVSGASQYAEEQISGLTVNDTIRIGCWVKSGTSGNEAFVILVLTSSYVLIDQITGTSSGTWTYYSKDIVLTASSVLFSLKKNTATAGTMLFDGATFKKVLPTWTNVFTNNPAVKRYSITNPLTMPGFLCEPARTNKCTCMKRNPTVTTNMSPSGTGTNGGLSIVTDMSAITAAGLERSCTLGAFYRLNNSTGSSTATVNMTSAGFGNTNPHSMSAFVKHSGGACVLRFDSNAGAVIVPQSSIFVRVKSENVTPTSQYNQLQITAGPGAIVDFILPQLEEGAFATSPICQLDQTASEARLATVLTYPTAGKIRSNNMAFRMIVVPNAGGNINSYIFATKNGSDEFELKTHSSGQLMLLKYTSGVSTSVTISKSLVMSQPIEILCYTSSTVGMQIAYRTYSDGWSSWADSSVLGSTAAKANAPIGTTMQIGALDGNSQFTGNISLFDTLPIPASITDPLAWAKQQWGIA